MSVIVSTFPSLNSFNSRSWVLAAIILLHMGFFWAFSSGLSISSIIEPIRHTDFVPLDPVDPKPERPLQEFTEVDPLHHKTVIDIPLPPRPVTDDEDVITGEVMTDPPPPVIIRSAEREPVVAPPGIDPRLGLSEPVYPSQEIRLGHTGTVTLAVQVLENGRIGEVRVEQSSGFPKLDEAAVRQAARWKLKPGTRDGVPVVMWKQIPITFRLKE